MKKIHKDFLIYTFIVYLAVAIDFFPFEMRLNPLDWENSALVRFMIIFFVIHYCSGFWTKLLAKEKMNK
tara:strand:- start:411 stop:617 length:207 start_codon:yes stop_codon:yes gene_type:complete